MSRATEYYIEVKRKDKWELVQCFTEDYLFEGYKFSKEPDLEVEGRKFQKISGDYIQGFVRDELGSDSDAPFIERGFPSDMSDALKQKLEGLQYAWGRSWCLLTEFRTYADKKIEEYVTKLIDTKRVLETKKLEKKIDHLIELVSGKETPRFNDNDSDEYYEEISWIKEELDNYIGLYSFVEGINSIASFITDSWCSDEDLRLVFYTC